MEQQTPIPAKSRMKPREGQKTRHFLILDLMRGGGGGGSSFSIYFVQDYSLPRSRLIGPGSVACRPGSIG